MKPKALVIDDDLEDLRMVGDILDSLNHDHDMACDQRGARKLLAPGKYSYVLLDPRIPVSRRRLCRIENGVNILQEIRAGDATKTLPVIIMSGDGNDSPELASYVYKRGATDYVTKPLDMGKLDRAIQEALGKADKAIGLPRLEDGTPKNLTPFKEAKREMLIYEDRITVCGVEVWKDCGQPHLREALKLLSQKDRHGYVRIRGATIDKKLGRVGSNPIGSRIKGFRERAREALREKNLDCGLCDIVDSGNGGYHFTEWMDVRVDGVPAPEPAARAEKEPAGEPALSSLNSRQKWVLEQIEAGVKLRLADIIRHAKVNRSTVNRDLGPLRKAGLIRLCEAGYYVRGGKTGAMPKASKLGAR